MSSNQPYNVPYFYFEENFFFYDTNSTEWSIHMDIKLVDDLRESKLNGVYDPKRGLRNNITWILLDKINGAFGKDFTMDDITARVQFLEKRYRHFHMMLGNEHCTWDHETNKVQAPDWLVRFWNDVAGDAEFTAAYLKHGEPLFVLMDLLAAAEVYAPRTIQVWRTLLNWMAFFFQIFSQILRGTPSFTQVLSYVGLRQGSFLSSAPHAPPQFKPLPVVELSEFTEEPEEALPPRRSTPAAVPVSGGGERMIAPSSPLEKLTVVLDLDETLVCAYETSSLPALLRSQATEAGIKWFELECISSEKEFEGKPKINYVTVFERPGLKEFLKQLSEFADLVLFTAGLEGYARPLVDRIDAENRFSRRLYRPSTSST
ncbi:probable phosphatase psr2 [Phtheirospermum japonicum]|uniref:Mitochondrial import inner membrane translocase subunit TIM50 n=1 Tax=Phtheirospermum japonicum TaxID=374723 RepID=A0A830C0K3_9LAMI|nr:probable phosphatase psr2 [Phtheirospermum japonicum]